MINIKVINNLQGKLNENINSKDEIKSNKDSEVKDDFKSFLNKEVKKDTRKDDKSVNINKDNKDLKTNENIETKETLETALEKINEVIDGKSKEDNVEAGDIIEVINLLSNLLSTVNINTEIKAGELSDSNILVEGNLDDIKSLLSEVKVVVNKAEESNVFNSDSDLNTENKGNIKNLKTLGDLINSLLEESKGPTDINLDKESLNREILNLLNSISEKDVDSLNLDTNQNKIKEIISSLVNVKAYNEELEIKKEPILLDKENDSLKDIIQLKVIPNNLDDSKNSNNSELGSLLKGNKGEEVSEDLNEEDKILSKFLVDDNKGSFGNILTSYDRFKNNPIDTIQKPEFINSQTIDDDIIKSVKYMVKNNMEELTVKIYPKELGELTIKILSEEGIMKAEIKATSRETYSILNANIAEIKNSLSGQDLKIQEVQVAIYNDDTTFFSGSENSKENQKNNNGSSNKVDNINLNENEDLIIEDIIESNVNLLV
ncbi:flagellar hook-length control protein FliK [Clostridium sp.]|uniref:flagellar hook-length control protein FliK n=1 Tax=Clostridium sp. TaxID=1506 RepID=UPI002625FF97|nr:flagellar hook-length control protein FliK [Clostridium sp.]